MSRTCAYCHTPRSIGCKCKYRPGRAPKNGVAITVEQISAEATLQEFLDSIRETLSYSFKSRRRASRIPATWKWSVTIPAGPERKKC